MIEVNSKDSINQEDLSPWVCFKGKDGDYDGHFYQLIGNKAGLQKMGEMLIELSNSNLTTIDLENAKTPSLIRNYDIVLDDVCVAETSFQKFRLIDKNNQDKLQKGSVGDIGWFIVILGLIVSFIIGAIDGLNVLYKILFR
jgi:hypothetical protein